MGSYRPKPCSWGDLVSWATSIKTVARQDQAGGGQAVRRSGGGRPGGQRPGGQAGRGPGGQAGRQEVEEGRKAGCTPVFFEVFLGLGLWATCFWRSLLIGTPFGASTKEGVHGASGRVGELSLPAT